MDIDKQKSGLRTGTEKCSPPFFYTGEQSEHSSREQKTIPCKRTHLCAFLIGEIDWILTNRKVDYGREQKSVHLRFFTQVNRVNTRPGKRKLFHVKEPISVLFFQWWINGIY